MVLVCAIVGDSGSLGQPSSGVSIASGRDRLGDSTITGTESRTGRPRPRYLEIDRADPVDPAASAVDLAHLVLKSICGNDPIARSGNRFIIWTDPNKPGGHSCQGLALQIAIGRGDADNADWFER